MGREGIRETMMNRMKKKWMENTYSRKKGKTKKWGKRRESLNKEKNDGKEERKKKKVDG